MRLQPALAAAGLIVAMAVGTADASTISFDVTYNPQDVLFDNRGGACSGDPSLNTVIGLVDGRCSSLAFTFSLPGFDVTSDTLTGGGITFVFYDDGADPGSVAESVIISLAGLLAGEELTITNGSESDEPFVTSSLDVHATMQTGVLSVLLALGGHNQGNNDFYFASSRLLASADRLDFGPPDISPSVTHPTTHVPEPAVLALLMLGGAAAVRRKLSLPSH